MRIEHGMPRKVYISCHDLCHTFRPSMECLVRELYICTLFLFCRFIYRFICSLPGSTLICRLISSHLQPSDSCYATPSAPRNRSTKTHGFIRIAITITIIQEQIHKSYISSTAARRSLHRFRRTCCPLPQHLQGSLACLSSGRRPGPGSHCLGRSTAAGREPHRFQGICCPLRLHLQ